MASQRRAPTKRPPRPAAKKPPPPPPVEGADAAERVSKPATPGATPLPKAAVMSGATTTTNGTTTASGSTTKAGGNGGGTSTAKGAATGVPKTNTGGGNYRPPSGAARSRRPPPAPRRKGPKFTKKAVAIVVALGLVGLLVVFFSLAVNGSTDTAAINKALLGPEQVAVPKGRILAAVDSSRYPQVIDGIKCETSEQLAYHIHAHLSIFVDGQPRQVPYGIGIAPPLSYNTANGTFVQGGSCFYWLHSHAADGIIHIESPTTTTYTLGQWFDVWGQPLTQGQVGPALGAMKIFVNGKVYTGDPRTIPLGTHTDIQLDVGSPAPGPSAANFPNGL